jgi:hypothetical protein
MVMGNSVFGRRTAQAATALTIPMWYKNHVMFSYTIISYNRVLLSSNSYHIYWFSNKNLDVKSCRVISGSHI